MARHGTIAAMPANRSVPPAVVIPVLQYADVRAAVAWLTKAFGFRLRLTIGTHRAQMTFGSGALVVHEGGTAEAARGGAHSVLVRVDNVDAHCAGARQHGATIVREPETYPYGERQYTAADPGGHLWTFSESVEDVDPAAWGGELHE
jgi:uncharacterized glyoxalase superfamily protein PhnB